MIKVHNSHLGQKIIRIRELIGMKQETLATQLGVSQQTVSRIEQSPTVDDEKLQLIAEILGVTAEGIKAFNEEAIIQNINNTFNDNAIQNQLNPLEKVVELYERLLREARQQIKDRDKIIASYKKQQKVS